MREDLKILADTLRKAKEPLDQIIWRDYLERRNKRIAIKRAVYIGLVLIITWGLVWMIT